MSGSRMAAWQGRDKAKHRQRTIGPREYCGAQRRTRSREFAVPFVAAISQMRRRIRARLSPLRLRAEGQARHGPKSDLEKVRPEKSFTKPSGGLVWQALFRPQGPP